MGHKLESPYCMHSGMANNTSWVEVTLSIEKIKPIALAIVELRESEGKLISL